ncbi:MAG: hypothetical protein ACRD42_00670 [Nitrososphaeraceae archaeon]
MIKNIIIISLIAALVPTAMSSVSASADAEIALFSRASVDTDSLSITGSSDSAKMELKATNDNSKSNKVSGFQLTADNVLSIEGGDKVTVKDNVDFTKAVTTDTRDNQKAIGITSDGVIDFTGYNQGVYTLDVVVYDDRAYEAIIVIGGQTQESVKSVTKEVIFEIYNGTGGSGNSTRGNNTSSGGSGNVTSSGSIGGGNMTENGNFVSSGGDGGSNMTQGITEFATVSEEPVNPCLEDPQSEECEQIRSQSCDALGCPGYPILEPEPEPIVCDEGEELADGQCQTLAMNPVEPNDLVPIGVELPEEEEEEQGFTAEEEEVEEEPGEEEESGESEDEADDEGSEQESEGESEEESGGGN